jgi:hypothetical protein
MREISARSFETARFEPRDSRLWTEKWNGRRASAFFG